MIVCDICDIGKEKQEDNIPPVVVKESIPFSLLETTSIHGANSVQIVDTYFIGCYKNDRSVFEMSSVEGAVFMAAETDLEDPEVGKRC